jgi:hypothetical protein
MWGCFAFFFFVDGRRLLVGGRFTSWGLVKTRGQQQTKRAGRTSSEMSTEGEMRCCCWWRCASSVCLALQSPRSMLGGWALPEPNPEPTAFPYLATWRAHTHTSSAHHHGSRVRPTRQENHRDTATADFAAQPLHVPAISLVGK